jgi:hypothetical protein
MVYIIPSLEMSKWDDNVYCSFSLPIITLPVLQTQDNEFSDESKIYIKKSTKYVLYWLHDC